MRSATLAAALILASAALLPRMGTYLGSKSLSRSTPSSLLGRSMMCPFEASTENPRPRNLVSVRDLVGDSAITSDRVRPAAGAVPPPPFAAAARLAREPAAGRTPRPSASAPRAGFAAAGARSAGLRARGDGPAGLAAREAAALPA